MKRILLLLFIIPSFLFAQSSESKATVYVFLSETCPICQHYTVTIKVLQKKYPDAKFVGVFPKGSTSTEKIETFKKEYGLEFETILDSENKLVSRLHATITPEVFIENKQGEIVYTGRIDDQFIALGKRKNVVTSNDLDNALQNIMSGNPIIVSKTRAVGCFISHSN